MTQELSEIMDLHGMSKDQLIGLCNALYEIAKQRSVQAPAFTWLPNPYVPPVMPQYPIWTLPQGGITVCNK
jgi:hypothetical protein